MCVRVVVMSIKTNSERKGFFMSRGLENAPDWLKWTMDFINRIGFPIAVCIYLGYQSLTVRPQIVDVLNKFTLTMESMDHSIKENTNALRDLKRSRE